MRLFIVQARPVLVERGVLSAFDYDHLRLLGAKAIIVTDIPVRQDINRDLPRGIRAIKLDGWDGSYHDPYYYLTRGVWVLIATTRRAGWLGRLRKAARMIHPTGDKPAAYEMSGGIIARAKGIWRAEGD